MTTENTTADMNLDRRIQQARLWAEQESRPFVSLIMRVRQRERPSLLICPDSFQVISDGLSERDRAIISQCEDWIRETHQRAVKVFGLEKGNSE